MGSISIKHNAICESLEQLKPWNFEKWKRWNFGHLIFPHLKPWSFGALVFYYFLSTTEKWAHDLNDEKQPMNPSSLCCKALFFCWAASRTPRRLWKIIVHIWPIFAEVSSKIQSSTLLRQLVIVTICRHTWQGSRKLSTRFRYKFHKRFVRGQPTRASSYMVSWFALNSYFVLPELQHEVFKMQTTDKEKGRSACLTMLRLSQA